MPASSPAGSRKITTSHQGSPFSATAAAVVVILVTPYLVSPSPAHSVPVPTDRSTVASDAEAIFLGRLENIYGVGRTGEMRGSFSGSVGFVLD